MVKPGQGLMRFIVRALEARNVRVVLAIDGFNPYGMAAAPYTYWPMFVIPLNLPRCMLSTTKRILVVDNSRTPGE